MQDCRNTKIFLRMKLRSKIVNNPIQNNLKNLFSKIQDHFIKDQFHLYEAYQKILIEYIPFTYALNIVNSQ